MERILIKCTLLILLACVSSDLLSAQVLDGKWKGYFYDETERRQANKKQYLIVEFILNADSSYTVYSYTNLSEFETQCLMTFSMQDTDSLHLEEIELIKPTNISEGCFQRMKLKLGRSAAGTDLIMMGTWDSRIKNCGRGTIFFQKLR